MYLGVKLNCQGVSMVKRWSWGWGYLEAESSYKRPRWEHV